MAIKVSFEFFPPASKKMSETLWHSIKRLEPLSPNFVSVTYGADGSTRDRTHQVIERLQKETSMICAPLSSSLTTTFPKGSSVKISLRVIIVPGG